MTDSRALGDLFSRARRQMLTAKLTIGALSCVALATLALFLFLALDFIFPLPPSLRLAALLLGLAGLVALAFKTILLPLQNQPTAKEVAVLLEKRYEIPNNELINAWSFQDGRPLTGTQATFVELIISKGQRSSGLVSFKDLWNKSLLGKCGVGAALACAMLATYAVLFSGPGVNSTKRLFMPLADIAPYSPFSLSVTPNTTQTLTEDENLEVRVTVQAEGDHELDSYPVIVWQEDSRFISTELRDPETMLPMEEEEGVYRYTFPALKRPLAFRVFAGGSYSESVAIHLIGLPRLIHSESKFHIQPPSYTGISQQESAGPPADMRGLPNSTVKIDVSVDRPIVSLHMKTSVDEETLRFQANEGNQSWSASYDLQQDGVYKLFASLDGLEKPVLLGEGQLAVAPDRAPVARFGHKGKLLRAQVGKALPLHIRVSDDFGVKAVKVYMKSLGVSSKGELVDAWTAQAAPGFKNDKAYHHDLKIDASRFPVGQNLELSIHAWDFAIDREAAISAPLLVKIEAAEELNTAINEGWVKVFRSMIAATTRNTKHLRDMETNAQDFAGHQKALFPGYLKTAMHEATQIDQQFGHCSRGLKQILENHDIQTDWDRLTELHTPLLPTLSDMTLANVEIRASESRKQHEAFLDGLIDLQSKLNQQVIEQEDESMAEAGGDAFNEDALFEALVGSDDEEDVEDTGANNRRALAELQEDIIVAEEELASIKENHKTLNAKVSSRDLSQEQEERERSRLKKASEDLALFTDRIANDFIDNWRADPGQLQPKDVLARFKEALPPDPEALPPPPPGTADSRNTGPNEKEVMDLEKLERKLEALRAMGGLGPQKLDLDKINFTASVEDPFADQRPKGGSTPGSTENADNKQENVPINEMAQELEDLIGKLDDDKEAVKPPLAGDTIMNRLHSSEGAPQAPIGAGASTMDNGLTGNKKPDSSEAAGLASKGRSGSGADGKTTARKLGKIEDNDYALEQNRISAGAREDGPPVIDEDNEAQTGATGLGNRTDGTAKWGLAGGRDPDALKHAKMEMGSEAEGLKLGFQNMQVALDMYNIDTSDLEKSMADWERAIQGGQSVDEIKAYKSAVIDQMRATKLRIQRKGTVSSRNSQRYKEALEQFDTRAEASYGEGYDAMIKQFYKTLANEH